MAFKPVRESRRAYAVLNIAYYGLMVCAMIFVAFNRSVQHSMLGAGVEAWETGPLAMIGGAYNSGEQLLAIALTFAANLFVGSLVFITLPSLIIPFSGLAIGLCRALVWGLMFCPGGLDVSAGNVLAELLILIVIFLEGQGYVLAMLAALNHGKAWLIPKSVGASNRLQGYWTGVKQSLKTYLLVVLALIVAAVYEVVLTLVILPWLA
ncbi:MAG: hypothetical protein PVJ07_08385 [Anaerolineales bacterium]|jgi:hypothetical protein